MNLNKQVQYSTVNNQKTKILNIFRTGRDIAKIPTVLKIAELFFFVVKRLKLFLLFSNYIINFFSRSFFTFQFSPH